MVVAIFDAKTFKVTILFNSASCSVVKVIVVFIVVGLLLFDDVKIIHLIDFDTTIINYFTPRSVKKC